MAELNRTLLCTSTTLLWDTGFTRTHGLRSCVSPGRCLLPQRHIAVTDAVKLLVMTPAASNVAPGIIRQLWQCATSDASPAHTTCTLVEQGGEPYEPYSSTCPACTTMQCCTISIISDIACGPTRHAQQGHSDGLHTTCVISTTIKPALAHRLLSLPGFMRAHTAPVCSVQQGCQARCGQHGSPQTSSTQSACSAPSLTMACRPILHLPCCSTNL